MNLDNLLRTDEEIIKKLRETHLETLDLKDCKSEAEILREDYVRLDNYCRHLVNEKASLKEELEEKKKNLAKTMELMQQVQETNKGLHALNEKLCKNLEKANRDFAIVAVLLWIVATVCMIYFSFII